MSVSAIHVTLSGLGPTRTVAFYAVPANPPHGRPLPTLAFPTIAHDGFNGAAILVLQLVAACDVGVNTSQAPATAVAVQLLALQQVLHGQ